MLKYLIEKEFKVIMRNKFLPKLILVFPVMMMLLMPWAANLDIKDIKVAVVDNDRSPLSMELVNKINSSTYFIVEKYAGSYKEAKEMIQNDEIDIILEIPENYERDQIREKNAKVNISVNAVNGTRGAMGGAYLSNIITEFFSEKSGSGQVALIDVATQTRYNPTMDYKKFMVPALMTMLLTLLCGFLPALNIVSEKESGTIEQINVTPIPKFTFIFSKLIPYWIIGFIVLTIVIILARIIYGVSPVGSLATFYLLASVFVLVVSGLGLVISNYSNTMQQAMFVMFFFMLVMIMMAGLFTPIDSMPGWAKVIAGFNPMRYFIEIMRMLYLKGSGLADLTRQVVALLLFAFTFNLWAIISYKKKN